MLYSSLREQVSGLLSGELWPSVADQQARDPGWRLVGPAHVTYPRPVRQPVGVDEVCASGMFKEVS